MTDVPLTRRRDRSQRAVRRVRTPGGAFVALLLVVASVAVLLTQEATRRWEAMLAEFSIGSLLNVGTRLSETGSNIDVGLGSPTAFTLAVSFACSVSVLIAPLALVGAAYLATGRARVRRVLPAVVIGAALLLTVNALRFVVIAATTHSGGLEGFGWAHTLYGSLIVLAGLGLTLVGFVYFITKENR